MDLKTFVAESLSQIVDGIRAAQARPGGDNVAADGYISSEGNLLSGGTSGFFTKVDFDVLVFAETKEGKPSVRVGDIETSQTSSETARNFSRVRFAVHVRLPKGGAVIKPASRETYTSDYDPYSHNYDDT
ncbi:hypothetical protein [Bradyrhizobium sp. 2TAF24]|uniref:hypothetical protein n=1 Tax=Bradyrhizobium sp. 2TAF24 TaxID=3233011 RepID=UPI003F8FC6A8